MAHKIPKFQWKNYTLSGNTTNGSPIVSGISSTSNLEADMYVTGAGIPAGTKILTVDSATQVTLDTNATATASGVSLAYFFEISFDYPPTEKKGEKLDPKERTSVSISGVRQVSIDYIEATRSLKFAFVTEAVKDAFEDFFKTHGMYGRTLRYFDDKTLNSYVEYELSALKFEPEKDTGSSFWSFLVSLRRVI
jgi:hypothetical protein